MKTTFPILYKKANLLNKINQWQIIVEGDKYYTISGYTDGKQFQNEPTICTPKNIGKKNVTTAEQQALFEANAMWQKRKDLGYWENIEDCDKKVFFAPMLAKDFNDLKNKLNYKDGVYSDPKFDGVRCIIKSDGMWTRNGKILLSTPHIFESLKHLFEENEDLILDGELYADKTICDFNTIVSCVRKTKPTKQDLELSKQYIKYWIYDCPSHDGVFSKRKQYLNSLNFPETCVIVDSIRCSSEDELTQLYGNYIKEGYEGQMVRTDSLYENKRSKFLMKRKEFFDEEFKIIGYEEGIGKFSGKLATIKVDVEGVEVDCTINGTMEYLEELFQIKETLIGKKATIKYFEKTTDKSLRFPKCIQIDRDSYE